MALCLVKYLTKAGNWAITMPPIFDQTRFHIVKGIGNAFDHTELCFVLSVEE